LHESYHAKQWVEIGKEAYLKLSTLQREEYVYPLGFLVPVLWKDCKRIKNILMIGLIVSLSIESLQFVECLLGVGLGRIIDIDDVICNVFGTILGYLIYNF
jgi:glycopeptide antibiotics resistance protein